MSQTSHLGIPRRSYEIMAESLWVAQTNNYPRKGDKEHSSVKRQLKIDKMGQSVHTGHRLKMTVEELTIICLNDFHAYLKPPGEAVDPKNYWKRLEVTSRFVNESIQQTGVSQPNFPRNWPEIYCWIFSPHLLHQRFGGKPNGQAEEYFGKMCDNWCAMQQQKWPATEYRGIGGASKITLLYCQMLRSIFMNFFEIGLHGPKKKSYLIECELKMIVYIACWFILHTHWCSRFLRPSRA